MPHHSEVQFTFVLLAPSTLWCSLWPCSNEWWTLHLVFAAQLRLYDLARHKSSLHMQSHMLSLTSFFRIQSSNPVQRSSPQSSPAIRDDLEGKLPNIGFLNRSLVNYLFSYISGISTTALPLRKSSTGHMCKIKIKKHQTSAEMLITGTQLRGTKDC